MRDAPPKVAFDLLTQKRIADSTEIYLIFSRCSMLGILLLKPPHIPDVLCQFFFNIGSRLHLKVRGAMTPFDRNAEGFNFRNK